MVLSNTNDRNVIAPPIIRTNLPRGRKKKGWLLPLSIGDPIEFGATIIFIVESRDLLVADTVTLFASELKAFKFRDYEDAPRFKRYTLRFVILIRDSSQPLFSR